MGDLDHIQQLFFSRKTTESSAGWNRDYVSGGPLSIRPLPHMVRWKYQEQPVPFLHAL